MSFLKHHKVLMVLAIICVIGGSIALSHMNSSSVEQEIAKNRVTLITAGDVSENFGVTVEGVVESLNQVELRSQVSAPVTAIEAKIGTEVKTGQILVTLQNADVIAQLNQAKAGLAAQQASLENIKKGARPEDITITETEGVQAKQNLENAYSNVSNTLNDAYAKADDAIRKQIDAIFSDDEDNPTLTFPTSDAQVKIDVESLRESASVELNNWKKELLVLSPGSSHEIYDKALQDGKGHLSVIRNCLNKTMDAVTANVNLTQATTDAYKTSISIGRTNTNAAFTAIQSQEQTITSLRLVFQQMQNKLASQKAGATSEQIAAQEAIVAQAGASVQNLEAQVAKTIVRAPVDGVVSAVPVKIGDLLTPGASIASIVNVDALQIKAYISEEDLSRIVEGGGVSVNGKEIGKVARIAPSINPTLKKIEVNILVNESERGNFIVGQNISVQIAEKVEEYSRMYLPIRAIRISDTGAHAYTVSDESRVDEIVVSLGDTKGEYVEVVSGLQKGMKIISDAYGIAKGQEVVVNQK